MDENSSNLAKYALRLALYDTKNSDTTKEKAGNIALPTLMTSFFTLQLCSSHPASFRLYLSLLALPPLSPRLSPSRRQDQHLLQIPYLGFDLAAHNIGVGDEIQYVDGGRHCLLLPGVLPQHPQHYHHAPVGSDVSRHRCLLQHPKEHNSCDAVQVEKPNVCSQRRQQHLRWVGAGGKRRKTRKSDAEAGRAIGGQEKDFFPCLLPFWISSISLVVLPAEV